MFRDDNLAVRVVAVACGSEVARKLGPRQHANPQVFKCRNTKVTFDSKDWIRRFGATLEGVVDSAEDIGGVPFRSHSSIPIDDYQEGLRRRFRELAALANEHPYAAKLFDETRIWRDDVPDELQALLLEHPVLAQVWSAGPQDGLQLGNVTGPEHADLKGIASHLAKLSARVGGEYAATRLHRFLVAGQDKRLHAHEIMILHGLKIDEPISLGRGAYLADYSSVRRRFGLDEDPEPWLKHRRPGLDTHPGRLADESSRCVLVRKIDWGPAVAPRQHPADGNDQFSILRYRFPDDHVVDSFVAMIEGRDMLLDLLSIAVESRLVSHKTVLALPSWMEQISPSLGTGHSTPKGHRPFDVWPDDRTVSSQDVETFAAAGRGWLQFFANAPPNIRLAVDRLVSSYGPAATQFGFTQPIIDVSIALEAMYGPFANKSITRKLRQRAGWLLGGPNTRRRAKIEREMCLFYKMRSKIVHGTEAVPYHERKLKVYLHKGRTLARETLLTMLNNGPIAATDKGWNDLASGNVKKGIKRL